MSTAAVSTPSIYQELQTFFQQRRSDVHALDLALQAGNLAAAQQQYDAIQALGQSGPFANGDAFQLSQREQDFAAIGQALQSGDLAAAQQAFTQFLSSFHETQATTQQPTATANPTTNTANTGTATGTTGIGPEVIVNLGNAPAGEEITIGLTNTPPGAEQVTFTLANQQRPNPEQITINLNPNSNEQVVLNFSNNTTTNTAPGGTVSVAA